MNFEDELKKRTESARERIKEQEQQKALAEKRINFIAKIKNIIESSVFEKICKYYPNAKIKRTHEIQDGKIVPRMGTFNCCILEFNKNDTYEFPTAARFVIQVNVSNDFSTLRLTSYFTYGQKDQVEIPDSYGELLKALDEQKRKGTYFYDGPHNNEKIIDAVESEILNFLDKYKEAVKSL